MRIKTLFLFAVAAANVVAAKEVCRGPDAHAVSVTTNKAGHVLLDFGKHAFGWLEADVKAKGPYTIIWGELLDANGSVQTNRRYTVSEGTIRCACTKGEFTQTGVVRIPYVRGNNGVFRSESLGKFGTVMPFRWAEVVSAPFSIAADTFRQVPVYYPYDMEEQRFKSSSPELDQVMDFCKHSIRATTFVGKFVDGDRERLPYEADSYITQLSTYAMTSDSAMVHNSIDHLEKNATWPTEWKQFFIRMCWADWMQTGDTTRLARCYNLLKERKLWLQLARPADGLLVTQGVKLPKGFDQTRDICDWGMCYRDGFEFRPVNAIVNALHYRNLLEMGDIATALGKHDDAKFFAQRADQVRNAFAKVLIDPATGRVRDGEGSNHFTVQANAMALACGVVPEANVDPVANYIVKKGMTCSTYMAQFVLEALGQAGRADELLSLVTTRGERGWMAMMAKGATITMEFWDLTLKEPGRVPDMNHAWSTAPINVVSRFVLGVTPILPGYGKVRIRPQFGKLERVDAAVPTPKGSVKLATRIENGRRVIAVETPVPAVFEAFGEVKEIAPGKHEFREPVRPIAAAFNNQVVEDRYLVRLSAAPFNQVWPGYQRPKGQTKSGLFANFDVGKPGWFELMFSDAETAKRAQAALRIRPLSRKNEVKLGGKTHSSLMVKVEGPEQFVMEFPGVAEEVHVFANPPYAPPPGKVGRRFGPGVHMAGMIRPKDGETIVFEPGAYVLGCLFLDGVKDVTITGRGVLDSSKMVRTVGDGVVLDNQLKNLRHGKGDWNLNSSAFTALDTVNVRVEGITMVDAPFWAMILRNCSHTVIDNVKLVGQWRYNADGIDVCYCKDTVIRNSFIRSFDDCIVARGAQLNDGKYPVDGLLAENCVLWCDWGKNLEVWGGSLPGVIRNVVYRNCKCVAADTMVCDVTVCGGVNGILYDGIRFEDIEVDVVKPLMAGAFQRRADPFQRYPGGEKGALRLLTVNRWGSTAKKDIAMRGIAMRRVKAYGDQVPLEVVIDGASCPYDLEKVALEDLPANVVVHRQGER